MKALLEKIAGYGFECEGGPLKDCKDWQSLLAESETAAEWKIKARTWQQIADQRAIEVADLQVAVKRRFAPSETERKIESTSIPSQCLASSEARPGNTPDEPSCGETHQRRVAPRPGSGEGVSQADGGERPASSPSSAETREPVLCAGAEAVCSICQQPVEQHRDIEAVQSAVEQSANLRQLLGAAIIRLKELGDTSFTLPPLRQTDGDPYLGLDDKRSLSDFIRNATPEEKEKVYTEVMKGATERQLSHSDKPHRLGDAPGYAIPQDVQEWIWHMDTHLTEHDVRHAGLALRAAWPAVRDFFASMRSELIQLRNRETDPSATEEKMEYGGCRLQKHCREPVQCEIKGECLHPFKRSIDMVDRT